MNTEPLLLTEDEKYLILANREQKRLAAMKKDDLEKIRGLILPFLKKAGDSNKQLLDHHLKSIEAIIEAAALDLSQLRAHNSDMIYKEMEKFDPEIQKRLNYQFSYELRCFERKTEPVDEIKSIIGMLVDKYDYNF